MHLRHWFCVCLLTEFSHWECHSMQAWLRELPTGVLDSLTPEQVMRCNTEEECSRLVKLVPPTESALLHWAINLMADVVQHETHNKMNARNIAMVFAPNMTQVIEMHILLSFSMPYGWSISLCVT